MSERGAEGPVARLRRRRPALYVSGVALLVVAGVVAVVLWDPVLALINALPLPGLPDLPDLPELPAWAKWLRNAVIIVLIVLGVLGAAERNERRATHVTVRLARTTSEH